MKKELLMPKTMFKGVCCAYCNKFECQECPVKTAAPWSKWADYCAEYVPDKKKYPDAVTLLEATFIGRGVEL